MEMMKAHKYNVERRLKYDNKDEDKGKKQHWYQHNNHIPNHYHHYNKKYSRRKNSLDPNWYTDNIYSNQSIENSEVDEYKNLPLTSKCDCCYDSSRKSSCESNDIFVVDDGNTINSSAGGHRSNRVTSSSTSSYFERKYNYPKSSSCCFGATSSSGGGVGSGGAVGGINYNATQGYDKTFIPKSHSFSTSRNKYDKKYYTEMIDKNTFMNSNSDANEYYTRNKNYQKYHSHSGGKPTATITSTSGSREENEFVSYTRICDRDGCVSETCLAKPDMKNRNNLNQNNNTNNNNNININNSNLLRINEHESHIMNEWILRNKNSNNHRDKNGNIKETILEDFDIFDDRIIGGGKNESIGDMGTSSHLNHNSNLNNLNSIHNNSFDEDYFSMNFDENSFYCDGHHQSQPQPQTHHRNEFIFDNNLEQLFHTERSKMLMKDKFSKLSKYTDDFTDDYRKSYDDVFHSPSTTVIDAQHNLNLNHTNAMYAPKSIMVKNKSMLEVKPPNKYDDTSSDSTELDLEDFNFDFEKYWEELDKSDDSPIDHELHNKLKNNYINQQQPMKVKNINIDRYNNVNQYIDYPNDDLDIPVDDDVLVACEVIHEDDINNNTHPRHEHRDEQDIDDAGQLEDDEHHRLMHSLQKKNYNKRGKSVNSPILKFCRKIHPEYNSVQKFNNCLSVKSKKNNNTSHSLHYDDNEQHLHTPLQNQSSRRSRSSHHHNDAISLLNNIFSIYKPNKYSPLNCHSEQNCLKTLPAKKINIPSTLRPLGVSDSSNEYTMSSSKRPLLLNSQHLSQHYQDQPHHHSQHHQPTSLHPIDDVEYSSHSQWHRRSLIDTTIDQARFQIIPDKTGLKISPLYRFDFDGRESKYKSKSTSRPLSFW